VRKEKPIKKIFFKSESDRDIWVRINAELVQYSNKIVNGVDKELGDINIQYSPVWISDNQLTFDEHECDALRFTLKELLLTPIPELFKIAKQREDEETRRMFEECDRERNRKNDL
jgi:hypothetical protein